DDSHPDLFTFEFDRPLVPRLNLSRYWRRWSIPWSAVRSIFDRPERQSHGLEKVRAKAPESATIAHPGRKRLTIAAVAASGIAAIFWIGANAGSPSKDAPDHGVVRQSASIRFG